MTSRRAKLFSPLARTVWLLFLAALAWFALRNAAIALFAQAEPAFALALPPASGEATAIRAMSVAAPDRQQAAAARALALSPMSYWPIAAAAEASLRRGDSERGIALLEEAARRNSRQADVRGRLFQLYFAQGRWSEGIDEGIAYARLRSAMADGVMESFLLLLGEPRGRAILARKLRTGADGALPPWGERLVRLSAGRPGERRLAALLNGARAPAPAGVDAAEPGPEAYVEWVASLPEEALPHVRAVYDGEFRGLPGAAPFNWTLAPGAEIMAGAAAASGRLVARASGGTPDPLARQLLLLTPGAYRLSADAAASGDSAMSWRITCRSGAGLAALAIPRSDEPISAETSFTVPEGCDLQNLELVASGNGESSTSQIAVWPAL